MPSDALENLASIGLLDQVPFSRDLMNKMLTTAQLRLADSRRLENSLETRFDCAYTAIRAIADAALLANSYRTLTSKPGHHQTTLQCLAHTLGVEIQVVRILDGLRKQRNLSDYNGELITDQALNECIQQALQLQELAKRKLTTTSDQNS